MRNKSSILAILPVMFGFFIMGFVDIIGMTTNYVKEDFTSLNDTIVNLLAISCFIWFLIFSIPTSFLMNKIGRKKTVLVSFLVQIIALCLIFFYYSFVSIMIAFSLVGIGNTILQVALNPLVTNVITKDKLTATLTLGQFVKAICSFTGPILVGWFSGLLFGWKLIFPVYAGISFIALIWLAMTPIEESYKDSPNISFKNTISLFKDKYIFAFFIGIVVLVGVDVSMNITFPKFLQESCNLEVKVAGLGNSFYFFTRTIGSFIGGIILLKFSEYKFYKISITIGLIALVLMLFSRNIWLILTCVSLFGLGYANLFAIIFSLAIKKAPSHTNEISALLIMGVSGGAILPPLLGYITDLANSQRIAILIIAIVWLYLFFIISKVEKVENFYKTDKIN